MTYLTPCSVVSIVNFEKVNADWETYRYEMPSWKLEDTGKYMHRIIRFIEFSQHSFRIHDKNFLGKNYFIWEHMF